VTPVVIAGIAFAGAILFGLSVWLVVRAYRRYKRTLPTAKGGIAEKAVPRITVKSPPGQFSRDQLTASIILPHQHVIRPDATKDEILRYHIGSGTMTRPFSIAASSTLAPLSPKSPGFAPRPVSIVSVNASGGPKSPRRTSFFGFGTRPQSMASSIMSAASSILGGEGRKVRQLFSPVLPDELVLALGERVTVVTTFDDGWCIVGRDSHLTAGEVEMGAVPAWCFVKPVKGLKASRPMRTSSLGVTVELDAGPGFSSREEVISWSNF